MSLYAAAWVYFGALLLTVAMIAALASARRTRPRPSPEAPPQIKWRCPICAYVFIEFSEQDYARCPRCESLLDAAQDATAPPPAGPPA